jgi:HAD superfamily hydrolase (TIGR01549 family)
VLRATISGPAAVTFDLWQTLIFEFDGSATSFTRRKIRAEYGERALSEFGETVGRETIERKLAELSREITSGHDQGFDRHYEDWVRLLADRIDRDLPDRIGPAGLRVFAREIDRSFIESPPQLLDGAKEVVNVLSGSGLKIGLISNTGLTSPETYKEWFSQIDLLDNFDYLAFSNGFAAAKPSKKIFDATLAEIGVPPPRALHVGDNMHTDVAGAAAAGMSTVWVRGGIESPVNTSHEPDYTVDSVTELIPVVERWLGTLGE